MRTRFVVSLVLALSALAPSASRAVTITFEGTIDAWDSSFLGNGASVGQMFSGVFELDPSATLVPGFGSPSIKLYSLPPFTIDVLWGGVHDIVTGDDVFAFNDVNSIPLASVRDAISFAGVSTLLLPPNGPPPQPVTYLAGFSFTDNGGDENGNPSDDTHDILAAPDFVLPTSLDRWIGQLQLSRLTTGPSGRTDVLAKGTLTRLAVVAVPEPGTVSLVAVGVLGLLLRRRRANSAARLQRVVAA
jgi:hypothetical protein